MIYERRAILYCSEDISLIENYNRHNKLKGVK